ncbi:MAG: hypothetical protein H6818_24185 [Phycisphaerales bacterium]|nr:hypothetical protein [Phycisphaerales bacterium]
MHEFFELDEFALRRVIDLYGREHGSGPRKYFESTFQKWRSGEVQPRSETQDRILHCVPRFLSEEKQFEILSFYIPEYMNKLRAAFKVRNLVIEGVPKAFADAAEKCRRAEPGLDWFVRGVFSDEEIAAFANVARYTALDRLHRSYTAVRDDLSTAMSHLRAVDAKVTVRYRLDEPKCVIELYGSLSDLPSTAFEMPPVPDLIVRHRRQYEQQLLDHYCDMLVQQGARQARHAVAQLDLSILQTAIASVSRSESIESSFQISGAGGRFEGTVCRKNVSGLKAQRFIRMSLAGLFTFGCVAGIAAAYTSKDLRGLLPCGIWMVLAPVSALWSWSFDKHREVREYERERSTRFAKD